MVRKAVSRGALLAACFNSWKKSMDHLQLEDLLLPRTVALIASWRGSAAP
jgi:hypothetical protein